MPLTADRDEGAQVALAAATVPHHDHVGVIAGWLDTFIARGADFTADDVRDALPPETAEWLDSHGNVIAGLFKVRAAAGVIRPVGYAAPRRARRRTNPNRIWRLA